MELNNKIPRNCLLEDMVNDVADASFSDFIEENGMEPLEVKKSGDGVILVMTIGGPNIWIDTDRQIVTGIWGSDKVVRYITDNLAADLEFYFLN